MSSPLTDQQKDMIRAKHASLASTWSPYDLLEVPGNATRDEIRAAFLKMSKTYHPDRYFGERGEYRRMLEEIFERVTWAHAALDEMGRAPPKR